MKPVRTLWYTAMLVLTLIVLPRAEAGEVLDGVKARGQVRCGVSQGIPGFSEMDAAGAWHGFDVDFCRAVAAAALGDPDQVAFVPLSATARSHVLQTHRIDLLLGNTTWTLTREAVLRVQFPGILFFDGQGFMVPAAAGIATLADLNGAKVCVEKGTDAPAQPNRVFPDERLVRGVTGDRARPPRPRLPSLPAIAAPTPRTRPN